MGKIKKFRIQLEKYFAYFDLKHADGSQEEKDHFAAFLVAIITDVIKIPTEMFEEISNKTGTPIPKLREFEQEQEQRILLAERLKMKRKVLDRLNGEEDEKV